MRMRLVCGVVVSLMLASCAESAHQHERMRVGQGYFQMPADDDATDTPRAAGFVRAASITAEVPPPVNLQMTQGQEVSLSGIVLKARRLDGMTEIEVLQLPLEAGGRPTVDRRQSQGRFLARQTTFLDPAILATGPTVTVHGVMEGVVDRPLEPGSDDYAYPLIAIRDLTIWPSELLQPSGGSFVQAIGPVGPSPADVAADGAFNFLGALLQGLGQALFMPNQYDYRRQYGYPSYVPNYSSSSSPSSHPPPPAQKDIPPQFRKRNQ